MLIAGFALILVAVGTALMGVLAGNWTGSANSTMRYAIFVVNELGAVVCLIVGAVLVHVSRRKGPAGQGVAE